MATPDHTPLGRGYESWLGYYQHANDYYTKGMGSGKSALRATGEVVICARVLRGVCMCMFCFGGGTAFCNQASTPPQVDNCLNRFRDLTEQNATFCGGVRSQEILSNHTYEEDAFKDRVLSIVRAHDLGQPLFLFYAFHLLHTPLQIPDSYLRKIDALVAGAGGHPFDSANRRKYAAMTLYLDEAVGQLVQALKAKGMWNDTMLVFITDNGMLYSFAPYEVA